MDLSAIKGVGPATEAKLNDAGVRSVQELADADPMALADRTGIPVEKVKSFVEQAKDTAAARPAPEEDTNATRVAITTSGSVAPAPATASAPAVAVEAPPAAAPEALDWRVVLRDRTATALVKADGDVHDELPIVTARVHESPRDVMAAFEHDAVLLQEQASMAVVRLKDTLRENVPIFKERILDPAVGASEEVRVRVHEIRERSTSVANGSAAKGGFFSKMFGKKSG